MVEWTDDPVRSLDEEMEDLLDAVAALYSAFAHYHLRPDTESCRHCRPEEAERRLHSRPLTQLTARDLDDYAFSALLTWGDVEDFKHFLPRLFELLTFDVLETDPEVLLSKLRYAGW